LFQHYELQLVLILEVIMSALHELWRVVCSLKTMAVICT